MRNLNQIKQGFSWWCFANRGTEPLELLSKAAKIGYQAVDLIDEPWWQAAQDHGLTIAAVNGHGTIDEGLNRRENAQRIESELLTNIEKARRWNIPNLICFAGRRDGLSDEEGLEICSETLARVAPIAASAGITLILELLNSKVDHADYQGDHTDWGVSLCEGIDSPAVKLLFDIYHMQVMEGDIIRTIQTHHAHFAHYHTAGNPGRGALDGTQELYYPAIYEAILETGYQGFITHEFIPRKGTAPLEALEQAFRLAY